jgi:hypothetical protein
MEARRSAPKSARRASWSILKGHFHLVVPDVVFVDGDPPTRPGIAACPPNRDPMTSGSEGAPTSDAMTTAVVPACNGGRASSPWLQSRPRERASPWMPRACTGRIFTTSTRCHEGKERTVVASAPGASSSVAVDAANVYWATEGDVMRRRSPWATACQGKRDWLAGDRVTFARMAQRTCTRFPAVVSSGGRSSMTVPAHPFRPGISS